MSIGVFDDKNHQPSQEEIIEAVGRMFSLWQELITFIQENYVVEEDLKFLYGRKYGWALRFRVRGKLLTSLYPAEGGFVVQINLSPEAVERAQALKPGENVLKAIDRANPYPEGRWLFIRVESVNDLRDIQKLLALRAGTKRL